MRRGKERGKKGGRKAPTAVHKSAHPQAVAFFFFATSHFRIPVDTAARAADAAAVSKFSRLQRVLFYAAIFAIVAAAQIARLRLTTGRWFCVDEFEHLHAAWCVAQGM